MGEMQRAGAPGEGRLAGSVRWPLAIAGSLLLCVGAATLGALEAGAVEALAWGLMAALFCGLGLVILAQSERLRRAAAAVESQALRDPLTGLSNRRGFEERGAGVVAQARRRNEQCTLLLLGLDRFADVRAELGSAAADDILRSVAFEALSLLRGEDLIARLEDEAFAVLMPQSSDEDEHRLIARVVAAVERAVPTTQPLMRVSTTAGSACYPRDGASIEELLEAAERGLHDIRAKRIAGEDRLELPLVPEGSLGECEAVETVDRPGGLGRGWAPARPGLAAALLLGVATAGWFALPAVMSADVARALITAVCLLAAVLGAFAAARVTAGRERAGWVLVGLGLLIWFVPFAGLVAGLASGAGLLFVLSGRWLSDDYRVLDAAGVLLSVSAFTIALLAPPLLEASAPGAALVASRISVGMAGAALTTAAILAIYWAPLRQRPDAILIALGYLAAVATTSPWSLDLQGWLFLPSAPWELGLPAGCALILCGALLRAGRSDEQILEAGELESRTLDATVAANVLLAAVVGGILIWGGPLGPTALIALLLGVILLRDVRSRLLERDRRELRSSALRSRRELAVQWRANLVSLSRALTARDGYTGAHSAATVDLSRRVARKLGLSREAVREVEIVAMLHDVGKIGIPDEILRAPRPLNEDEWRQMREHPVIGERILRSVPGLEQVARSVRHEHERWDGSGYPDGLAGRDIPLPSRIVFACDAFDAIASERPYRPATGRREAMAKLQRGAGTQFDPAVIRALLDALLEEEGQADAQSKRDADAFAQRLRARTTPAASVATRGGRSRGHR